MAVAEINGGYRRVLPAMGQVAVTAGALHPAVKLYLVMVLVPIAFSVGPLVMTGVRLLMLVMILPMVARLFSGKCGRLFATDYLFLAHLFWIMVTLAVNNPAQVVQNFGSTGMEFLGGYLLGRNFIRSKESMIGLFRFATILVVCTLPLALYETLTGVPILLRIGEKIPGISMSAKAYSPPRMGLERVQLAYNTPIHYGIYATMAFSLCLVGLKGVYSGTRRLVSTVIIGVCVFLSLSSGALLPMMLQGFLVVWNRMFRTVSKRWLLLLAFAVFCYVVIDLLSNRTPYRVFMTYATFSPGTAYWRAAINEFGMNNVWAHPIFGIGLNDWMRAAWMHSSSVDNFWLLMAMRHGIPGFLLVAAGYGAALWHVMRANLGTDPVLGQLRLAWVFTFACMAFTLTTVHVWTEIYSYVFFSIGSAMWLLSVKPEEQSDAVVVAPVQRGGAVSRLHQRGGLAMARPESARQMPAQATVEGVAEATGDQTRAPQYTRFPVRPRDPA